MNQGGALSHLRTRSCTLVQSGRDETSRAAQKEWAKIQKKGEGFWFGKTPATVMVKCCAFRFSRSAGSNISPVGVLGACHHIPPICTLGLGLPKELNLSSAGMWATVFSWLSSL